jgi:hypothetical protein
MFRIQFRWINLQQSFLRRSQQAREPTFLFHLLLKYPESLLGKGMRLDENPEMIGQAFSQLPFEQRTAQKIQTALLQSPERCNQVPTVDRGNELWPKRLQCARVIPVVQVTMRARKDVHRCQGAQVLLGKFVNRQESEFAGGLAGVKK